MQMHSQNQQHNFEEEKVMNSDFKNLESDIANKSKNQEFEENNSDFLNINDDEFSGNGTNTTNQQQKPTRHFTGNPFGTPSKMKAHPRSNMTSGLNMLDETNDGFTNRKQLSSDQVMSTEKSHLNVFSPTNHGNTITNENTNNRRESLMSDILMERSPAVSVRPSIQRNISIPYDTYQRICEELRCPICKDIFKDPIFLPCNHVFCKGCLASQVTNQKTFEKVARCAECNIEFSRRNRETNLKFNKILECFKEIRTNNNLLTQIPEHFDAYNPFKAAEKLRNAKMKLDANKQGEMIKIQNSQQNQQQQPWKPVGKTNNSNPFLSSSNPQNLFNRKMSNAANNLSANHSEERKELNTPNTNKKMSFQVMDSSNNSTYPRNANNKRQSQNQRSTSGSTNTRFGKKQQQQQSTLPFSIQKQGDHRMSSDSFEGEYEKEESQDQRKVGIRKGKGNTKQNKVQSRSVSVKTRAASQRKQNQGQGRQNNRNHQRQNEGLEDVEEEVSEVNHEDSESLAVGPQKRGRKSTKQQQLKKKSKSLDTIALQISNLRKTRAQKQQAVSKAPIQKQKKAPANKTQAKNPTNQNVQRRANKKRGYDEITKKQEEEDFLKQLNNQSNKLKPKTQARFQKVNGKLIQELEAQIIEKPMICDKSIHKPIDIYHSAIPQELKKTIKAFCKKYVKFRFVENDDAFLKIIPASEDQQIHEDVDQKENQVCAKQNLEEAKGNERKYQKEQQRIPLLIVQQIEYLTLTAKVVHALVQQIPIVAFEWIVKMNSAKQITEKDHHYTNFMRKHVDVSTLFSGLHFELSPDLKADQQKNLRQYIPSCGGVLYKKSLMRNNAYNSQSSTSNKQITNFGIKMVRVGVKHEKGTEQIIKEKFEGINSQTDVNIHVEDMPKQIAVNYHWVLFSIMHGKLVDYSNDLKLGLSDEDEL